MLDDRTPRQEEIRLRLATVRLEGVETAAIVLGDRAVPLATLNDSFGAGWPTELLHLLAGDHLGGLRRWLNQLSAASLKQVSEKGTASSETSYAPLYRRPRKIWGIGLNYVEHAEDLHEVSPSDEPASFMRPDTTIIGPGDEIRLPEQSGRVTVEAELGLIIGREAKDIPEEEVPSAVAGFTTVLDTTAEDILRRNPRYLTRAKSFDTFFSFGPELVTTDEIGDVGDLEVSTVLNGEVRRTNTVSNMTFSPWSLVSFHSRVMRLLPGDVISTGTPGAVVIREGDVAGCRISGFKPLANPVVR
jgi:2-keto-4-pentenoate hydratase/2-oxohepta-3-ene-1,7-dioic acid hydratase in catechol pathway